MRFGVVLACIAVVSVGCASTQESAIRRRDAIRSQQQDGGTADLSTARSQ